MVEVGRDLCRSSGPIALPKQGQWGQVIQDHIHTAFVCLQGWRLYNLYLPSSVTKCYTFVPASTEELPISSCLSERKKKKHTKMRTEKMLAFPVFALLTPQFLDICKNLHKDFIKWSFTPTTLLFLWKWIINLQKFLKLKPATICHWSSQGFFSITNCLLRYHSFSYPAFFIGEI